MSENADRKARDAMTGRLISGVLLLVIGLVLVTNGTGGGIVGLVALIGAAYQLITAAVARGAKEGGR